MVARNLPLIDRLVLKTRKAANGCVEWHGANRKQGYGKIGNNKRHLSTHRVSFEAFVGPIPDGLFVLHRCDNPMCVNPAHLFLGTNDQNMADMKQKGRTILCNSRRAKLTPDKVRELRRRSAAGESAKSLASVFGIGEKYTRDIIERRAKSWSDLA